MPKYPLTEYPPGYLEACRELGLEPNPRIKNGQTLIPRARAPIVKTSWRAPVLPPPLLPPTSQSMQPAPRER